LVFDAKGVYYLEKKLDYEVVEDQASAKFDRKRKELKIVLPIVQLKEVIHQIPDDVPLEVDEVEETGKNKKGQLEGEMSKAGPGNFEGQAKEEEIEGEGEGEEERENKEVKVERNQVSNGITEIGESNPAAEMGKSEYENNEKENIESEIKKFPEGHQKLTESSEPNKTPINPIPKSTKPQPCCIKLKSPLLFTLS